MNSDLPPPERKTVLSADLMYRYVLWREWDCDSLTGCSDDLAHAGEYVNFIMLNPSTADANVNDPTLRRCIGFAKAWGYGAICVTNLFAYRTKDPKVMKKVENPVGIENHHYVVQSASSAGIVVCAWGANGTHRLQDLSVRSWLSSPELHIPLHCIRKTERGHPEHPLYLPGDLKPIPFP